MGDKHWIERHPVLTIFLIAIIVFFGVSFIVSLMENPYSKSISVGEEGRLYQEGFDNVAVCSSKFYLDEMIDAAVAKDKIGWNQLFSYKYYKRCYLVPKNTKILVLDTMWGTTKFRILEGEYYAEVAWTNMECIK